MGGVRVAAIVLAAGRSSRLGRPKQLVPFGGHTLLRRSVLAAVFSPATSVTVVLGAFFLLLKREIKYLDVAIVKNRIWQAGMGSSLKVGLQHVLERENPDELYDGFLFLTCDQPLMDEFVLSELVQNFSSKHQIVASSYNDALGVPAIFGRDFVDDLLRLKGDVGARSIFAAHSDKVTAVPFVGGDFDIDTTHDLKRLPKLGAWLKNRRQKGAADDDFLPT